MGRPWSGTSPGQRSVPLLRQGTNPTATVEVSPASAPFAAMPALILGDSEQELMREHLSGIPVNWTREWVSGPILLAPTAYQELGDVAAGIVRILEKSYLSLGSSFSERARNLGIDWEIYHRSNPYFLSEEFEREWSGSIARPDIVFTAAGVRVLEANFGSAVGGLVQADLLRSFWAGRSELFAAVAEPPITEGIARLVLEFARAAGVAPRAAILGLTEYHPPGMRESYHVEADFLAAHGIEAEAVTPGQLVRRLGAKAGTPWPIALRRNRPERWAGSELGSEPLRRLAARGCHVLSPQSAFLMADKRLLAFVSAGLVPLEKKEVEFVIRHVPWTRLVQVGKVEHQGDLSPLERLLELRQDAFVLKRGSSRGGIEVIVGRQQTRPEWASSIRAALRDGDWVVQEFQDVLQAALPVADQSGSIGSREFTVVLSPFVVSGRSYGCVTRLLRAHGQAVVSTAKGAACNIAWPTPRPVDAAAPKPSNEPASRATGTIPGSRNNGT
jgi:hypothetical protein